MNGNKEHFYRVVKHPIFLWFVGMTVAAFIVFVFADAPISRLFIMTEHFMYEYDHKLVAKNELLSLIFFVRIPILFLLIMLYKSPNRDAIKRCLCLVCGFAMGYLFFRLAENYGFKGIVLCFFLWMPHMFLYLFAGYHLMYKTEYSFKRKVIWCVIFLIGIFLEAYFNPVMMDTFATAFGK